MLQLFKNYKLQKLMVLLIAINFSLLLNFTFVKSVNAATYVVDTVSDANLTTCSGAAGDCSLRGALTNANEANSSCPVGGHTIEFNIPGISSGSFATIGIGTTLPAIDCPNVTIDGTTQENTLTGTIGIGGTVGIDGLTLNTIQKPDILIVATSPGTLDYGLWFARTGSSTADDGVVRGISIYGFANDVDNIDFKGNIRFGNTSNQSITGGLIENSIIGSGPNTFTDPGLGNRTGGPGLIINNGSDFIVRNNLVGFNRGSGVVMMQGSSNSTITNNEIRGNSSQDTDPTRFDGVDLPSSTSNITVSRNLLTANGASGIDMVLATGSHTIVNNTIHGNGIGENVTREDPAIRVDGDNNTFDRNIIFSNYGAGIMVLDGAITNLITRNSIFGNGDISSRTGSLSASNQIGIDLLNNSDDDLVGTSPFYTINDSGDSDAGGNNLNNFPVIEYATIESNKLVLSGFARPGATIELFISDSDQSGFGEGQTYLTTLTEGASNDLNTGTGSYSGLINGINQGADTTNRFLFSIDIPSGVSLGTPLTSTATLSNVTSEFSGQVQVTNGGSIGAAKSAGPEDDVGDDYYEVLYSVVVKNTGNVLLNTVQVTEDLTNTFEEFSIVEGPTSSTFAVNSSFNGDSDTNLLLGTDTLAANVSGTITFKVKFKEESGKILYQNQVKATAITLYGTNVSDDSTNGVDVDPDGDGDPTNNDDPTVVDLNEDPSIGVSKKAINLVKQSNGSYNIDYEILVKNTGDVKLNSLRVSEDLNLTFGVGKFTIREVPTSDDFEIDNNYNGNNKIDLLTGSDDIDIDDSGIIKLKVNFFATVGQNEYKNTANAEGFSEVTNQKVTDKSQDSDKLDPDPDDDGDPTNNNAPTIINIDPTKSLTYVGYTYWPNMLLGFSLLAVAFVLFKRPFKVASST